jgi:hypothetical protein
MPGRSRTVAVSSPETLQTEARWFVRGSIPRRLRPAGQGRVRIDLYHAPTLNPVAAWKRRDRRTPEFKFRAPNPRMVRVGGIGGIAEQWRKLRPPVEPVLADDWLAVRKRLWERPGLQIAEVRLEGATWSTIAVRLDAVGTRQVATALERWHDVLEQTGIAASYPTWLLARRWLRAGDEAPVPKVPVS